MYDFDSTPSRIGTGSIKWDQYQDPEVIALSNADMDYLSAPCIREALIKFASGGQYGYTLKPDSYYDAITGWFCRRYNLKVPGEWILHTPGVWPAARICFGTYAKPGDRVLVQAPHFHPIIVCAEDAGCEVIINPMLLVDGKYELDLDDFRRKVEEYHPAVFFMVNPQNPTGRTFTREELEALGTICADNGVVMISDEVHANILFDGHEHITAVGLSQKVREHVVLLTSPSKGYNVMGLTHCILLIPDKELRKKYEKAMTGYSYDFAVNSFSIVASEAAMSPEADSWLQEVNTYLSGNLDYMTEYMERNLPRMKVIRPESGYLVWVDCREMGMSAEELHDLFLKKAKVGLTFGEGYGVCGEGFERFNIAVTRKVLAQALERIKDAVER
ncbi:aminotransferase class I/II-fold pyridoxal phosphate-dependent enzyme [Enterocloster sp. OA13]|uniref:MalY/PatB family protein n=1 Tax=Enterocloster sp. OA13 TaxID=2914161 RepID=UPI0004713D2E|nr:aminotransferase class I/II-fold pyridoxal phosphate-dependent enzyme [Enterocloster sp. OA13]